MNCTVFDTYLSQHDEAGSAALRHDELVAHTAHCGHCYRQWQQHERYLAILTNAPIPELDSGRAARLLRRAGAAQKTTGQRPFVQGFIAASVLALGVLLGLNLLQNPTPTGAAQPVLGQYDWTQEVTIAITAPHDMDGAHLVLQLPPNMGIEGYEYRSEVVWPLNLKQGRNTIVLPVLIDELAIYEDHLRLPASLIYNNSQKDFELTLELDAPQNPSHGQHTSARAFTKLA